MEKSSNRSQTFLPGRETSMGRLPSIQSYSIISIIIVICFLFFVFFFKPSPKVATRKRRRQILAVVFRWSAPPKRGSRSVANKRRSRAIRHFKRKPDFRRPQIQKKTTKKQNKTNKTVRSSVSPETANLKRQQTFLRTNTLRKKKQT